MTNTTASAAIRAQQWLDKYHSTYIRDTRFFPYMGKTENAIIQVKEDLTKKPGDAITIPLVGALDPSAGPNTGGTTLVGNEKALPNDGFKVTVGVVRDGVVVNNMEEQASAIDIYEAARMGLKDLQMRYLRNDIINALGKVDGVLYSAASAANKNAWTALNVDRVLFGTLKSNYNATHATALANVTSAMKLSKAVVSLMKRMAQTAVNANGDGISPVKTAGDNETYMMFVGTNAFRDLKTDIGQEWRDAQARGADNPLFVGTTSVYWDGVIVREIPEIAATGNVGASSATVAPVYLTGSQALAAVWAQRTDFRIRKEDDYGYQRGVAFQEIRAVDKIRYGQTGKDWALVTGFVGAASDA
jgi:hypothetical protein